VGVGAQPKDFPAPNCGKLAPHI